MWSSPQPSQPLLLLILAASEYTEAFHNQTFYLGPGGGEQSQGTWTVTIPCHLALRLINAPALRHTNVTKTVWTNTFLLSLLL